MAIKPKRIAFTVTVGQEATAAVTVAEAKDWVKETTTDHDTWFADAVIAGTNWAVMFLGQALVQQSWGNYFDKLPDGGDFLELFPGPIPGSLGDYVDTVTSFQYYDTGGTLTTMPATTYQVQSRSNPPRIYLKPDQTWPTTEVRHDAVQVVHVAGLHADESTVQKHFKWPILAWIAAHFRDRECPDAAGLAKAMDGLRPYQKKQQFATF